MTRSASLQANPNATPYARSVIRTALERHTDATEIANYLEAHGVHPCANLLAVPEARTRHQDLTVGQKAANLSMASVIFMSSVVATTRSLQAQSPEVLYLPFVVKGGGTRLDAIAAHQAQIQAEIDAHSQA